ncbi:MAG: PRC-barrel domain-containing protein [Actinomycetota bacterium]
MEKLIDRTLFGRDGAAIGVITDVIADPSTLEPEWVAVRTGRLRRENLVPLAAVQQHGESLVVPFERDDVKHAPSMKTHVAPTGSERISLYQHFGITPGGDPEHN